MLAVTGVVLLIIMSGRFVNYLAQAASGSLNADFLFAIMGYRLPEFLVMIIPLGLFLGIILAYGRLYVENEMTIMGATGMSQGQLLRMTMLPAMGVMLVVAVLSLFIAPKGIQQVEMLLIKQDAMTEFDTLVPGRFQLLEGGSRVTYTEALSSDRQQMQKVFIASRSDDISSAAMSLVLADSGRISTVEEQGQRFLIFNDGFRYDMTPGMGNVRVTEYETYGLRMEERTINYEISREQALPTGELMKSDDTRLIAELQWRLSLPLLVPIIVLLAVPLSRVSPRQGRFVKLLPGVLLYLFYLALLMFARSAVDDQRIPATIGVWWVHAIYLAIGLFMVSQETLQLKLGRSKANA